MFIFALWTRAAREPYLRQPYRTPCRGSSPTVSQRSLSWSCCLWPAAFGRSLQWEVRPPAGLRPASPSTAASACSSLPAPSSAGAPRSPCAGPAPAS